MIKKTTINYITNSSPQIISGGWSGLNYRIFGILEKNFKLNYIGPINPKVSIGSRVLSKTLRSFKIKSNYYFYSENRLNQITQAIENKTIDEVPSVFFGSTPYINYKPLNDYYIITDISFPGYYKYYNKASFKESDLQRIIDKEREFFIGAKRIFFTTAWGLKETCKFYNLKGSNFFNMGVGGNMEMAYTEHKGNNTNFLFISNNFYQKGGYEAFEAFKIVYQEDNTVRLKIIGEAPPKNILEHPGVESIGYFDKTLAEEFNEFKHHISHNSILVVPTKGDVAPIIIIECGYFGTPSIAPNKFGIPEFIIHNKSGFLLDPGFEIIDLVKLMSYYNKLTKEEKNLLRSQTFKQITADHNWDRVENILVNEIGS